MRYVIVGEAYSVSAASSPSGKSGRPLSPFDGPGGVKLASLIGCTLEEFIDAFERRNLFEQPVSEWDRFKASKNALLLQDDIRNNLPNLKLDAIMIVMMGRQVENAFIQGGTLEFFVPLKGRGLFDFVTVPHPSGVSHWWNDSDNVKKATEWWKKAYEDARKA